jgi:hypothetical protein
MREIRTSGSEGGESQPALPDPYHELLRIARCECPQAVAKMRSVACIKWRKSFCVTTFPHADST